MWSGDPRLSLGVKVMCAPRRMQHPVTKKWLNRGDMIAKQYVLLRWNEDGTETEVNHWQIEEFDKILTDVAQQKAGYEGKIPSAIERIDLNNSKIEKAKSQEFHDFYGAAAEHAMLLAHDRSQPQTTFRQMPGSNPDKQL